MSLREYKNLNSGESVFVFDDETEKLSNLTLEYKVQPPRTRIIHATESFMAITYQLDSINSIHDFEEDLNREAEFERETFAQNEARRNT